MSELRAKFLAAAGPKTRVVPVPGIGDVTVRGLTGSEYDRYESACTRTEADKPTFSADRPLLARLACLDGDKPLFTEADDAFLRTLPAGVLMPLANAVLELSGLTKAGGEALAKN